MPNKPPISIVEATKATIKKGEDGLIAELTVEAEGRIYARELTKCVEEEVLLTEDGVPGRDATHSTGQGLCKKVSISGHADKPTKVRAVITGALGLQDLVGMRLLVERSQMDLPEQD